MQIRTALLWQVVVYTDQKRHQEDNFITQTYTQQKNKKKNTSTSITHTDTPAKRLNCFLYKIQKQKDSNLITLSFIESIIQMECGVWLAYDQLMSVWNSQEDDYKWWVTSAIRNVPKAVFTLWSSWFSIATSLNSF